jgi:hypothetical protein
MKLVRVSVQAEYQLPDDIEFLEIDGEKAFRFAGQVVRPSLEFLQFTDSKKSLPYWEDVAEEVWRKILESERHLAIDVVCDTAD